MQSTVLVAFVVAGLCAAAPHAAPPPAAALAAEAAGMQAATSAVLRGRVVDEHGAGISGARVEVVALPVGWRPSPFAEHAGVELRVLAQASTDGAGGFALDAAEVPEGPFPLRASAAGRATLLFANERVAFGREALPRDLELTLPRAVTLHGVVLDERARPVGGVLVGVRARSWNGEAVALVETGRNGRYQIDALPEGARIEAIAEGPGGELDRLSTWTPRPSRGERGRHRASFHLQAPRVASGRLLAAGSGTDPGAAHRAGGGDRVGEVGEVGEQPPQPIVGARVVVFVGTQAYERSRSWRSDQIDIAAADWVEWAGTRTDANGAWALPVPDAGLVALVEPGLPLRALPSGDVAVGPAPTVRSRAVDAAGRPVGPGRVSWSGLAVDGPLGADGSFALPEADRRRALVVEAAGLAAPQAAGDRGSRFVVERDRTLSGTVRAATPRTEAEMEGAVGEGIDATRSAEVGPPLAGATVRVLLSDGTVAITACDGDGRFSLGVPPGMVHVEASFEGWIATWRGGARGDVELVAGPAATLEGRLVASERAPGGGARPATPVPATPVPDSPVLLVPVDHAGRPRLARTDGAGRFIVGGLAPGAWQAVALDDSLWADSQRIDLEPGARRSMELDPRRGGRVRVRVLDPLGQPVADARVRASTVGHPVALRGRVEWSDRWRSETRDAAADDGGEVILDRLWADADRDVTASAPGHAPASGSIVARSDLEPPLLELVLEPAGAVSGMVVDASGLPVEGATIAAEPVEDDDDRRRASRDGAPELTDSVGAFRLGGLPPGSYHVKAGHPHHLTSEAVAVSVAAGQEATAALRLRAGEDLTGSVLAPDGSPAAGAVVHATPPQESAALYRPPGPPEAETGEDGSFRLRGLEAGVELTVHATREGDRSAPLSVAPGSSGVELRLVALATIEGVVVRGGEPVEKGAVSCSSGASSKRALFEDPDGRFEVEGLEPGAWGCSLDAGEGERAESGVIPLAAGETAHVVLEIEEPIKFRVRVVDAVSGEPLAGAKVWVHVRGAPSFRHEADDGGTADLVVSPLRREATLNGWTERHELRAERLSLPPPAEVTLRLVPTDERRMRGRVVDEAGAPVAGARVWGPVDGRTDEEGRFDEEVHGEPGMRSLSASKEVGDVMLSGSTDVTVGEGDISDVVVVVSPQPEGSVLASVTHDGEPAERVRVELHGTGARPWLFDCQTDAAGECRIAQVPADRYRIALTWPGGGTAVTVTTAEVRAGRKTRLDLEVPDGLAIEGRVVRSGAPVAGARIELRPASGSFTWTTGITREGLTMVSLGSMPHARSDSAGRFRIEPVPEDEGRVMLVATAPTPRAPGDRSHVATRVELPPVDEVVLDLAGVAVTGSVVTSEGSLEGATVRAFETDIEVTGDYSILMSTGHGVQFRSSPDANASTLTDPHGRFRLDGLPPNAQLRVVAEHAGLLPATEMLRSPASGAGGPVTLELRADGGLRGRALDIDGPRTGSFELAVLDPASGARPEKGTGVASWLSGRAPILLMRFQTADGRITMGAELQVFNLLNEFNVFAALGRFEVPPGVSDPLNHPPLRPTILPTGVDVSRSLELGFRISF